MKNSTGVTFEENSTIINNALSIVIKYMDTICKSCRKEGASIKCNKRNCSSYYHFLCATEINKEWDYTAKKAYYCDKHNDESDQDEEEGYVSKRRKRVDMIESEDGSESYHEDNEDLPIEILSKKKKQVKESICICNSHKVEEDIECVWIQCDQCFTWYHNICMKISKKDAKRLKTFICPICKGEHPSEK